MKKMGIYIGRFQPFHTAHLETVKLMLTECEQVIISVGSHNRPKTIKNPWTSEERIQIIKKALIEEYHPEHIRNWRDLETAHYTEDGQKSDTILSRVTFQTIRDYMYNNNKWAAEVYSKAMANGATHDTETVLYGHYKDDSSFYLNMYPQWGLRTVPNFFGIDATQLRVDLFETKTLSPELEKRLQRSTKIGLKAWIHGDTGTVLSEEYNYIKGYKAMTDKFPYGINFVTADALVIKSGHVLLIKRGRNPGKGLWALPGGFLDTNETQRQCAIRELKEETKIKVPKAALDSAIVTEQDFQHPNRSLRGRVMTKAFLIDLGVGPLPEIKASDDAVGAHWVPLADFHQMESEMFEDHYDIIFQMTSRY
jgi:bifunctional NMN adenylyltransferase/nudix hydrolase